MKSKTRDIIEYNIFELIRNKDIKEYKLTGPTSIGKSFTLFRISHIFINCIYINLKVLNKNKEDLYLCYSIIISELERLDLANNELNELKAIIQDNYSKNKKYLALLLNIVEYLSQIEGLIIIVILDQFKKKYIINSFMEKITAYENIKIVLCGSINDKNYREECLKTWTTKGKNILKLTIDIQNYYIYYSSLYNYNNEETNNILKKLGNIPKYKEMYKANLKQKKEDNELLKQIKTSVKEKLEEFYKNNNMDKNEVLIHLKYIINKEYNYDNLESIIRYCPLKFFFVYFTKYNFRIIPIFPYMLNIIKAELTEDECNNYFQKEKYKFNTIENDSVKGDYFEGAAKFGLQKIIKNSEKFKVNEIVTMEKIINEEDEIMEEGEYIEMYNNIKTLLKRNEEKIFINDETDTNNNVSKNNENEKEEKYENYIQTEDDEDNKELEDDKNEVLEGIEEEVKENEKDLQKKKVL